MTTSSTARRGRKGHGQLERLYIKALGALAALKGDSDRARAALAGRRVASIRQPWLAGGDPTTGPAAATRRRAVHGRGHARPPAILSVSSPFLHTAFSGPGQDDPIRSSPYLAFLAPSSWSLLQSHSGWRPPLDLDFLELDWKQMLHFILFFLSCWIQLWLKD